MCYGTTQQKGLILRLESKPGWKEHDTKLPLRKILKKIMTEVPQGSVLESFLLNTLIFFLCWSH